MEAKWVSVESKGVKFNVSTTGQIATNPRIITAKRFKDGKWQNLLIHHQPKIMSTCVSRNGYLEIAHQVNGCRKKFSVHRLIALAFVPGYFENATVNHINGNKLDNSIENLEWVTLPHNTVLEWGTGLVDLNGEKQPMSKLTARQVRIIRKAIRHGLNSNELSILCNISPSIIYGIQSGKRWKSVQE